jgi:arginine/ornithine transport system substrate-binding protein
MFWAGRSNSTGVGRRGGRLAPVLALLVVAAAVLPAQADGLRIGVFGQDPPRSFSDEHGQLAGFDIDVARALCAQLRYRCDLVPMEWSALIPRLEAREIDAVVASMSITDERRKRVDFTRPYYVSPARFVVRNGMLTDADWRQLKGKRIGVRRGTTFDHYITDKYAGDAEVVRYSTQPGALLDLVLGRLDLVIGDALVLEATFLNGAQAQDFGFVGRPLTDPRWFGYGHGIAVAKNDRGLRTLLDRAIADIHVNGVFDLIRRLWFGGDLRVSEAEPPTNPE